MTFVSSAQNGSEHLTFKGIPIDGTLTSFVQKMKQKGFTHITTSDGTAIMGGTFAGYKDCTLGIISTKGGNLVYVVNVIFPSCDTWSSLEIDYLSLKDMLTEKYGTPSDCVEEFRSYSPPEDDSMKMIYLKNDKCKYRTFFQTEKGDIMLRLTYLDSSMKSCVTMSYRDSMNEKVKDSDAMDDL